MKNIIVTTIAAALVVLGQAQSTLKKDVTVYLSQLPPVPATLKQAYDSCKCINASGQAVTADTLTAGLHAGITADLQSLGTLTGTQTQQAQQAMQLGNQANADNVNNMSKTDKMQWVQNNMQGYGNAAGMANFAQKLQDPAEMAKFKALTPAQQLAYMKQSGMDPMKAAAAPPANTNALASDAINKQQALLQSNYDPLGKQLQKTMDSTLNPDYVNRPHNVIDLQMQKELNATSINISFAQKLINAKSEKIHAKYLQQHLTLAQQQLVAADSAYTALLGYCQVADTAYANAMKAVNYGYTGDANQDQYVSKLTGGQYQILSQAAMLEGYINQIYQFGAGWQYKALHPVK